MNDHLIGTQRRTQMHAPGVPEEAAEKTLKMSHMQEAAAAEPVMQGHASSPIEYYTISVQQVRDHLRSKGLIKSKDTIQRWCRAGDLDCQKLGVLGRYFTTETSLLALEQKLLPDMIAEGAGAHSGMQLQPSEADDHTQQHAGVERENNTDMPVHAGESTAALRDVQRPVQLDAAASSSVPQNAEVAELRAEVAGLTKQLEQAQEMNQFLREEIVSSRGQRGDVVKIAEQMLGTLETIAIGGRLERPKQQQDDPQPTAQHPMHTRPIGV